MSTDSFDLMLARLTSQLNAEKARADEKSRRLDQCQANALSVLDRYEKILVECVGLHQRIAKLQERTNE